jgi:hypothetical protein
MFKNVAGQKIAVFAFDTTTGVPKTGDAANITAYVNKDFAGVNVLGDTSATEIDSTNAKGWYVFDLTQAETNGDLLLFSAKSATANISLVGQTIYTVPQYFNLMALDSSGRITVGAIVNGAIAAATFAANALDAAWSTAARTLTAGTNIVLAKGVGLTGLNDITAQSVWDALTSALSTVGSIGKLLVTNIDAAISSRMATFVYTSPDNTSITAIKAKTDNLPAAPASTTNITAGTITTVTNVTNDVGITQVGADKVWGSAARTLTSFGTLIADIWSYVTRTLTSAVTVGDVTLAASQPNYAPAKAGDAMTLTTGERTSIGTSVWASATRTLTAISDSTGITTLLTRIASVLTITGGKVDVNDKTGFALTTAEHTGIAADTQTGLNAQGYTSVRAGFLDTLSGLVSSIWTYVTRTLTQTVGDATAANQTTINSNVLAVGGEVTALSIPTAVEIRQEIDSNSIVMQEVLGLLGKYYGLRNTVYDIDNNLTNYDICIYDGNTNATLNDGTTGLVSKYSSALTYDLSNNILTNVMTKVV